MIANHPSDLDPVVTQYACPRMIHFMAKRELWEMRFLRPVLNLFRAFPVNPRQADRKSLRTAVNLLKEGRTVCVFPEGGVTRHPPLSPLLPGVTLIARMSGATVICLGIRGTSSAMPLGTTKLRKADRPIIATWGEPNSVAHQQESAQFLAWIESELRTLSGADEATRSV